MTQWGYVTLGWIATYAVVIGWWFTSRMPVGNDEQDKN